MGWTQTYSDIVDSYFWVPSKIGLTSIPGNHLVEQGDHILVPRQFINPNGPLYRRTRNAAEVQQALAREEEPLNDLLTIATSIMADHFRLQLFFAPLEMATTHPVSLLMGGLDRHFGAPMGNFTQPDLFLFSADAAVGVELKLGARLTLKQIAKYVVLLSLEENRLGQDEEINLGLLVIVPENRLPAFCEEFANTGNNGRLRADLIPEIARLCASMSNSEQEEAHFFNVAQRLRFVVASWTCFADKLRNLAGSLNAATPEGATAQRLLSGLECAVRKHKRTRVPPTD